MSSDCRFSRRSLLQSLGLGAAFVPLLGTGRGHAASAAPRRLIILQWTNGVIADSYWPKGGETDFSLAPCMKPLEPYRQHLLIPSGVGLRCQIDSKVSGAGVGHQSLWSLLTGKQAAQGRNDAGPCGIANGISVDQYVANAIAKKEPNLKFKSLELGAVTRAGKDNERSISYRGPAVDGRPSDNPPEVNPVNVFNRLFGGGGDTGPGLDPALLEKARLERKSVLDFVKREMGLLKQKIGSTEAEKIEQHEMAIRQLETELTAAPGVAGGSGRPVNACGAVQPPADLAFKDGKTIDKLIPMQMDLLVAAMKCDLTRVATMMMCTSANDGIFYPFLGLPSSGKYLEGDHHAFAHSGGANKIKIDTWWMSQLAYLLGKLKATPDVEGNMLDNTLVVMANHMDNGGGHGTGANVPWILAGDCQGYYKTGRYVTGHSSATPHNQLLVSIANAMTAGLAPPLTSFGDTQYGGELTRLRG